MAEDWNIKPRGEVCRQCETPFQDHQVYWSALLYTDEGYVRADHCTGCWEHRADTTAPFSTWQGVFKSPPPAPEEPLKKETAESLLRRLMEDEGDAHLNVIYILAVMLERKRILIERDVRSEEDGRTIRVYEHRKTGEGDCRGGNRAAERPLRAQSADAG